MVLNFARDHLTRYHNGTIFVDGVQRRADQELFNTNTLFRTISFYTEPDISFLTITAEYIIPRKASQVKFSKIIIYHVDVVVGSLPLIPR